MGDGLEANEVLEPSERAVLQESEDICVASEERGDLSFLQDVEAGLRGESLEEGDGSEAEQVESQVSDDPGIAVGSHNRDESSFARQSLLLDEASRLPREKVHLFVAQPLVPVSVAVSALLSQTRP